MSNVKWCDAVKAFGKGRVKKGTDDYKECKALFESMKQDNKKEIIVIEEEEKKDCIEIKHRKSVIELLQFLKNNKK